MVIVTILAKNGNYTLSICGDFFLHTFLITVQQIAITVT